MFGLAVGSRREVVERYEEGTTNSADRVKELDQYIELGYLG